MSLYVVSVDFDVRYCQDFEVEAETLDEAYAKAEASLAAGVFQYDGSTADFVDLIASEVAEVFGME